MPRIPFLRVIVDAAPNPGRWNMAVDEVLLETAISSDLATLRWYEWNEPTVSLGYFQSRADLDQFGTLGGLPAVKRLSGGGAIVHDDEVTYSLALPPSQRLFHQPHELYGIVHGSLLAALHDMGFSIQFRGETTKRPEEPYLCFQRQDAHDMTLAGHKVLGSAQRRRRGAILQHGSLIRHASRFAMQIPGLADVDSHTIPSDFTNRLAAHLAGTLADSWEMMALSAFEIEKAHRISES